MKRNNLFMVCLVLALSALSLGAQAAGIDVHGFIIQHADAAAGLSMMGVGNIELLMKSLDKIEGNLLGVKNNQAELADRVLGLEQRSTNAPVESPDSFGIGDAVVKAFSENRELFEKTRSVRLELKAAADPVTTTQGRRVTSLGAGFITGGVLGLQNALPGRSIPGTSAVEYSRYTGMEGAVGQQATEGSAKAAVRPTHTLITQSAITIAGYSKMSRQALNDAAELRKAVEVTLRRSASIALDTALVDGATGFAGGYGGLATAYTSLVYTALVDAVSEGVSDMQTAGFSPDVVALNPADWLAITVAKGTANDHYLSGSYLGAMPTEMRGLRVVLSPSVDVGTALLMDSTHSELLNVDGFTIEIAYSGDDFTNNLSTVLGEMRFIPVFRTVGSARLITPKA